MSNPINFPAPALSQAVKQELNKKADTSFLTENYQHKNTQNWHMYYFNPGENNDVSHYVRVASWVHTGIYNEFNAVFKFSGRRVNADLNVSTVMGNGVMFSYDLFYNGNIKDSGYIAQLRSEDVLVDGAPAVKVSLWVKHGNYQLGNYVAIEHLGGFSFDAVKAIKLDYVNDFVRSTTATTVEPTEGIERARITQANGGINGALILPKTPLVMINGFATDPEDPLSCSADALGRVNVTGVIKVTNPDGSPANTAIWTSLARLPSTYFPSKTLRQPCAMGTGTVNIVNFTSGYLQFSSTITTNVYINFSFYLD